MAVFTMIPAASAILEFNDGRDKVIATAEYGIAYDSNLFARADGAGDYNQSLTLGANYTRHAGMISVNAAISVNSTHFRKFTGENFTNPSLNLELAKAKGRLTGSVAVSAQRESSSDVAANLRADSWNYGSNVKLRYPINERYYFTSLSDFSFRDYTQHSTLFNLASYAESIDVYYVYTSKLDLLGGYRVRTGEAVGGSRTLDNALTLGATGGILPKLSGSLQLGYQWRNESGATGGNYSSLTSNCALTWPMTRQMTFSGAASKDFTTAATDVSVDTTAFNLSASFKPAFRMKVILTTGVGYDISDYLGSRGDGRRDNAVSYNAGLTFSLTSKIASSISYTYSDNHSNAAFSNFARSTASFTLSARY